MNEGRVTVLKSSNEGLDSLRTDIHVHTTYCDGKNTPREMVEAALKKRVDIIGILAHSFLDIPDNSWCMKKEDYPKFIKEVNELKEEYKGKILILCGIEQDYYSPTDILDGFDYMIGAVHVLEKNGELHCFDDSKEHFISLAEDVFSSYEDMYETYYSTVAKLPSKLGCKFIAHFDLISKFNSDNCLFDEDYYRYIRAWKKSADTIMKYGANFEINTGGMYRGYRNDFYPKSEILKYILQNYGTVIPTSDAHETDAIFYKFEKLGVKG